MPSLSHSRSCFGEYAAVKLVNDAQVHAIRLTHHPIYSAEKAGGRSLGESA